MGHELIYHPRECHRIAAFRRDEEGYAVLVLCDDWWEITLPGDLLCGAGEGGPVRITIRCEEEAMESAGERIRKTIRHPGGPQPDA